MDLDKSSNNKQNNILAIQEAQKAFAGVAEAIGYTEEQILEDIMRMRYGEDAGND